MTKRSEALRMARRLGWRFDGITGSSHVRLTKPGRPAVTVASSPSCWRWRRNALAQLRRADRPASDTGDGSAAIAAAAGADPPAVSDVSP
jgi:hypothetical protein